MTKDVLKNEYGVNVNNKTELERTRAIAKEAYQRYFTDPDWVRENGYNSAEEAAIAALTAEKNRKASAPTDYTQGVGSGGKTNNNSGSNAASNGGATVKDVQGWWNDYLTKFNAAYKVYTANARALTWNEWGPSNNKTAYSWQALTASAQGMPNTPERLAYDNLYKQYQAYAKAFETTEKAQKQGAKKTMDTILAEMQRLLNGYPVALKGYKLPTYDIGGMVDKTGLAMVHAKEGVLTPEQVDQLRQLTLTSSRDSLAYQLAELNNLIDVVAPALEASANNSIVIENATVEMNVGSIANDYEARRAGEQALEKMLEIARKTSVQTIRR